MKKITKIILFPFLRLLVAALFSTMFVMVIIVFLDCLSQFIGKGLGVKNYFLLVYYLSIASIPQALPLAIMFASIVSTGNLAESSELIALKSSGIPSSRILRPLIVFMVFVVFFAYYLNSFFVPKHSLKGFMLLYDINKKKPEVMIQEGVFCDAIQGFSIKVEKKQESLYSNILIYDHRKKNKIPSLITAKNADILYDKNAYSLIINLLDGNNYLEFENEDDIGIKEVCKRFLRINFKTQKIVFELNSFKLKDGSKNLTFKKGCTKNDLEREIVCCKNNMYLLQEVFIKIFLTHLNLIDNNIISNNYNKDCYKIEYWRKNLDLSNKNTISNLTNTALKNTRITIKNLSVYNKDFNKDNRWTNIYEIELYKMFAWALSCLTILIIGSSLGIIIKKGGLGLPLIISAFLLLTHYVIEIITEKLAIYGKISTLSSAFAANYVMIPLGLILYILVNNDLTIFEKNFYKIFLKKIIKKNK